jgi:hypothetical protein
VQLVDIVGDALLVIPSGSHAAISAVAVDGEKNKYYKAGRTREKDRKSAIENTGIEVGQAGLIK